MAMVACETVEEEMAYETIAEDKTLLTKGTQKMRDVIPASGNETYKGGGVVIKMRARVVYPRSWGHFQQRW